MCLRNLLFTLCTAAALIQAYGCSKAGNDNPPNTVTTPQVKSTATASANCVDSMVGTYYGRGNRWGTEWINGSRHDFSYDGPDTLWVTKSGPDGVSIYSSRIARSDYFVFDSSKTMISYGSINYERTESTLDYFPLKDSLIYHYGYQGSNEGTFCSFVGGK